MVSQGSEQSCLKKMSMTRAHHRKKQRKGGKQDKGMKKKTTSLVSSYQRNHHAWKIATQTLTNLSQPPSWRAGRPNQQWHHLVDDDSQGGSRIWWHRAIIEGIRALRGGWWWISRQSKWWRCCIHWLDKIMRRNENVAITCHLLKKNLIARKDVGSHLCTLSQCCANLFLGEVQAHLYH